MLIIGLFSSAKATHIVGGEITYRWVSGNTYLVTLNYYRDCSGIAAPTLILNYRSYGCSMGPYTTSMSQTGTTQMVSPICPSQISNASCNGGTLYSVEKITYQATVTLPANCSDWWFYYHECCRNGAITNLSSPSSNGSYLSASLNNLDVPFNNSVAFNVDPVSIISNGVTTNLHWASYDSDGDSLVYELIAPREYNGFPVNISYSSGFTAQQPMAVSSPMLFDPATGDMEVTPNALQTAVVCMRISEYRNGVFIGRVNRDFQIAVIGSTNSPPSLTGINATNDIVITGCPGDPITFNVYGSDPDAGQTLSMSMAGPSAGASFTSIPGTNPTGTFNWTPLAGDVSSQPYIFPVTIIDDHCNYYATETKAYHVYVNGCNTNDVWPGDANSDGVANLYDLLAVGLAFNNNGPVRNGASYSWVAQPATDWTNSFISGINHKHADTDGNGVVNLDDTLAIALNYGLSHPIRLQSSQTAGVADLSVVASVDTTGMMSAVSFDVLLTTPVDSVYGLAFRLFFDPSLVNMTTADISYPNSFFGTSGIDMIKLDHTNSLSGFVDIALSRINQQSISGIGPVARITIVTTDNVSGKVTLNVTPTDVEAITASGDPVTLNPVGDDLVIDPNFTGTNDPGAQPEFSVGPVPSGDFIQADFSSQMMPDLIHITDLRGKVLLKISPDSKYQSIDIRSLSKGVYFLRASFNGSVVNKKIVKI
jgi:hypothetical protein